MGMSEEHLKAHKAMADVVEKSFRKMSKYCQFSEPALGYVSKRHCLYNGRAVVSICKREICPVLEKE